MRTQESPGRCPQINPWSWYFFSHNREGSKWPNYAFISRIVLRHSETDWTRAGKIQWWEAWSQWLGGEIKLSRWVLILKMWTRKENSGKINQKEREKTEGWECVSIWTCVLELAKTSTNALFRGSSEGAGKLWKGFFHGWEIKQRLRRQRVFTL